MPVVQQGSLNTTALVVPDVYVQIVPPQVAGLNGVPTNVLGAVGTAAWGPLNAPTVVGDMAGYARQFGAIMPRRYDLGTGLAAAVLQGANNFVAVRVTDGSDVPAHVLVQPVENNANPALVITSKYSGSLANGDVVSIGPGSQASTTRVTIARSGLVPEVFDNISGTGVQLWANVAAAINNGQSGLRGASELVTAASGSNAVDPLWKLQNSQVAFDYTLAGGTDGAADVSPQMLVGNDVLPRSGMYALRNTGASIAMLVDCDDKTTFSDQVAFGLAEGCYMIGVGQAGESLVDAMTAKASAGIDSYAFKWLLGDWVYFNDTVNGLVRLVSPQGFVAGRLANLSPEQSALNKPLMGVLGTEKSSQNLVYSSAELGLLGRSGIDVIANPSPGGKYFSCRFGHNSSSNPLICGDNYTRLTNYIAYTLNSGMGQYVGLLHNATERANAQATLTSFLGNMEQQGMIGDPNGGSAFSVVLDASNNPSSRVAQGYMQADVQVKFLAVIEKFLINVEGGASVQVVSQSVTH